MEQAPPAAADGGLMHFQSPAVALVPLLRAAMRAGYKAAPSGIARKILDDRKFILMLNDLPTSGLLPDGRRVHRPYETSWWLTDDTIFYGNVSLRHELTPETERFSGHIGYAVHPEHQGKGLGTRLLQHGLQQAKIIGLPKVLLTIDVDNVASCRVAEKCGAILQDTIYHPYKPGTPHRRYWITF